MQRETLLRCAGTHADGPRISSALRRKRDALRSIRGTKSSIAVLQTRLLHHEAMNPFSR
jgi:hypothetical protein